MSPCSASTPSRVSPPRAEAASVQCTGPAGLSRRPRRALWLSHRAGRDAPTPHLGLSGVCTHREPSPSCPVARTSPSRHTRTPALPSRHTRTPGVQMSTAPTAPAPDPGPPHCFLLSLNLSNRHAVTVGVWRAQCGRRAHWRERVSIPPPRRRPFPEGAGALR